MRTPSLLVLAVTLAASSLAAQAEYRSEQSDALGVKFLVHKKLFAVPLKLGEGDPNERAKYEPKDDGDYIHGRLGTYSWGILLLEFSKKKEAPKTGEAPGAKEATERRRPGSANFREWVTENDPTIKDRKFVKKAVQLKGKKGNLDCVWWEYTDSQKVNTGVPGKNDLLIWYKCAGTFDLPDREVAIVATVPVKKGTEADDLHMKWMETMCQSIQLLEAGEAVGDTSDAKRDEFANTPERKAELEKAKANIANLKGWNYFTMPDYIVLHSWDPEKETTNPQVKRDSYKTARDMVQKLQDVRERYIMEFPPHDKMAISYPVLRICQSYDEFQKYGDSPGGVIGWFSPRTKELVVFDDKEHYLGAKDVDATVRHEGWHQYADSYFGGGEKTELHRWFDEGHGDYFGGWSKKGKSWSYGVDKGRQQSIRAQISRENFIPVKEIVGWNKDKFYGPRAPDHYAQGYSLIDFLRRGPSVLGKKFDESWTKVIPTYTKTMLETKDQKKAVEAAFAGVDWDKFQATWIDWVKGSMK